MRVLVVDDYRDAADALGLLLAMLGVEVRVCHGGADALRVANAFRPHVGLLDVDMPGMGGCELARRLRLELGGPLLLVAATGVGSDEARGRTAAAGFDLHWTKTRDVTELLPVMTTFCRTHFTDDAGSGQDGL